MDITEIPFNAHVGLTRSTREGGILALIPARAHENHLGTIHASVLFALAEASSGEFLIQVRGERSDIGGVVRRSSAKFSRPATGEIYSRAKTPLSDVATAIKTVDEKGKTLIDIKIEVIDAAKKTVAMFEFVWLLALDVPETNS